MSLLISSTGYWGIPGRSIGRFTVHAQFQGRAICGTKFHRNAEYQFCADGLNYRMLECAACKKIVERHGFLNMTKEQALQEILRIKDSFDRLEQEIKRLRRRLVKTELDLLKMREKK